MRDRDVYAEVAPDRITLGNAVAERSWSREGFATLELLDKRRGGRVWSQNAPDFRLLGLGAPITSDQFSVTGAEISHLDRAAGCASRCSSPGRPGITATRIAEAYPRIAGFRTQTIIQSLAPLPLTGATLDEAAVGDEAATAAHNLRAGADWRSPDYAGPADRRGRPADGHVARDDRGRARRADRGERRVARGERGRPLARDGDGAQRPALLAGALRRQHGPARARLRARRDHPRPARGERAHREPVRGRRPPARGHPRRAVRARARLRRARRARRRRGVAALRLPRPSPPDAVSEGDHLQQQRHRQRRPLDRREGRPRHRR